jgi:superfamily II DNA/RNA helicase
MSFSSLELTPSIQKAIVACGYTNPTPIQEQAIPVVLSGRDLMAAAQTGTGKTAAFVLPALQLISKPAALRGRGPRVLVLTPTRELAGQIAQAITTYGKFMRVRSGTVLGGMPYPAQMRLLSEPLDILVATPGRLIDHLERGRLSLARLEMLVLDEADRMLDMGFIDDVEKVAAASPAGRQTLLFTATLDDKVEQLARRLLKEPELIRIDPEMVTHDNIDQRLHLADDLEHKRRLLHHLVLDAELKKAIIFSATKRDAELLAVELHRQGHSVAALHGDMNQGARNRTVSNLRRGAVRLLVATDVAARGLDVHGISHVINFDLPRFAEDYVHRIGRTGRAGLSGIAISFASHHDLSSLSKIERYIGRSIAEHVIPGLEPVKASRRSAGRGPSASRRPQGNKERWNGGQRRTGKGGGPNSGGFRRDRSASAKPSRG